MQKAALALGLAATALAACGGGGTSGGGTQAPGPAPTPAPAPSPTPTPAPTPTPTLAADPGGAMLANATLPGELDGLAICSAGQVTRVNNRVTNFVDSAPPGLEVEAFRLQIGANYTYSADFNGFGGPIFPSARRMGGRAFEVLSAEPSIGANYVDELQIAKPLTPLVFATYGFVTSDTPCFFAVGVPMTGDPATLQQSYSTGFGDGLLRTGSDHDRLYRTRAALSLTSGQVYSLTIEFAAVSDAFAEPDGQTARPLGRATTSITLDRRVFRTAPLTAPGGFVGEVTGVRHGVNFGGALFVFDLRKPNGDRMWGVLALDADAM